MSDQSQAILEMNPRASPGNEQQQQHHQHQHQQQPQPQRQQTLELGWGSNQSSTLLVVATLITTLTYQIGCNPPGGFWQDDKDGHTAGTPIMRDKFLHRYWLFMTAAWVGFADSILLTLWLLLSVHVDSRRVRWSFIVAYSSLQLTYISAMFGTSLLIDLATWAGFMIFLFLVVGLQNRHKKSLTNVSPCFDKLGFCR
ncbi:hypothetical protein J5N97_018871 [Dioscorea zingiberensis]|uniref:PGG domain-containing protein n=1 Tax=Dioscorea zingiberensis TaxID=325984 RepID=A0A9D5CCY9_9LILI|nr:hypothetical protein J5N97_018871 [Dioscorea zingiberensis]